MKVVGHQPRRPGQRWTEGRTMIRIDLAAWCDRGQKRDLNEDRVFYQLLAASDADPIAVCMVADGMGGHLAGEVASHWAIETLKRGLADLFVPADPRQTVPLKATHLQAALASAATGGRASDLVIMQHIREAVSQANLAVRQYTLHRPNQASGAGSTITLALLRGRQAYVANVGDSRAYLFRSGRLVQLTRDHSLVADLVASGRLSLADSFTHPQAGAITRCLGCSQEVEVDIEAHTLRPDDMLLLCSDGLWSMLRDTRTMSIILRQADGLQGAAEALVDAANRAGGDDNIAVGLMHLVAERDIPS
jgi:PPM family protein phosphatase